MVRRRDLVGTATIGSLLAYLPWWVAAASASRVRPGDPAWPSEASWEALNKQTNGRLIRVRSPLTVCRDAPVGSACRDVFRELKNPYYIGDTAGLAQTTGWLDAWTSQPSVYAVAAETTGDIVAAVNFARINNLRLVVRGGGHSYLGTSSAPDSLMIWTRRMNAITLHETFVPQGCEARQSAQPAVSVGAGAIWMHTYNAVTTGGGRYVQGGGCGTVGVAGLTLGGGFGSYSKTYGTAAASLLEAEVVTADGVARVANACTHRDLFWALKGGGGGSFGVVTRLTLRTHKLPELFGYVGAVIHATSDAAMRRLLGRFIEFYAESLMNPHWGEIVTIRPGRRLEISMSSLGLGDAKAETIWQPFLRWVTEAAGDFAFLTPAQIASGPARHRWDPTFLRTHLAGAVRVDDRPGASQDNIYWSANVSEAGHFIYGFESAWLPAALLQPERREQLADALFAAGTLASVELHFQKGLAGAPAEVIAAAAETATNHAMLDAFVLAIIANEGPPAYPGLPGYAPDIALARRAAEQVARAMATLRTVASDAGSYVAESNFFERDWQRRYWGENYDRLLAIKRKYDPDGLFFVHHGVGSEAWTPDGFTRMTAP
jgi:FAD/FMN-containing dehydrogenase